VCECGKQNSRTKGKEKKDTEISGQVISDDQKNERRPGNKSGETV